ncbi:MAG: type II secretion system protein [Planctomycetes bacterium]|nr:type II secretion system protein [Planctomycetota bacterium]
MRNNRGYSLIELLIAAGIFALAVPGVLAILSTAGNAHRISIHRTRMALLAQTVLDEARHTAHMGGEVDQVENEEHSLFPGYHYDVTTWPLDLYGREQLVEVVIRWYELGRAPAARGSVDEGVEGVAYYTIICVK